MKSPNLKHSVLILFSLLLLSLVALSAEGLDSKAIYELETGQKIIAIGDLHGDLQAFKTILRAENLINRKEEWQGGKTFLVLLGDLVDRGPESKELMDFVIELETKAQKSQGRVFALLGNHEYLVSKGFFRHIHPNDLVSFNPQKGDGDGVSLREAYQGHSKYATWFRTRKVVVKIGRTLFVHAGLDHWVIDYSIDDVNNALMDWLLYYQSVAPKPDTTSEFLLEEHGPLWTRRLSPWNEDLISERDLDSYLQRYGADKVVVGHTIITQLAHTLNHPNYGNKVVMVDSAISIAYSGDLTALEITNERLAHFRIDRKTGARSAIAMRTAQGYQLFRDSCVQVIRRHK